MIESESNGQIRTIRFAKPDRRNALTEAGLRELESTFGAVTEPIIYLTGAGDVFCAGADLDVVSSIDTEKATAFARLGQRVATAIESYDGVVVAGIDGAARGGGVELALACDIRVATPDATLAENGVSIGLFGAWGGTSRLPRVVGEAAALDIALTGRVLDATEAKQLGLVTQITDDPRTVAESLASNDDAAMRTTKRLLRRDGSLAVQETLEAEAFEELLAAFQRGESE